MDNLEINDYIREYLRHYNCQSTLECFEAEIRTKPIASKMNVKTPAQKLDDQPRLCQLLKGNASKVKNLNTERDLKQLNKKYGQVLQAARQIFSVSVNCLQLLHNLKDVLLLQTSLANPLLIRPLRMTTLQRPSRTTRSSLASIIRSSSTKESPRVVS